MPEFNIFPDLESVNCLLNLAERIVVALGQLQSFTNDRYMALQRTYFGT